MDNDRADGIDKGRKILNRVFIQAPLNFIERKFGYKTRIAIIILATLILISLGVARYILAFSANWKSWNNGGTPKQIVTPLPAAISDQQGNLRNTPLQDVRGIRSYDKPCQGEPFEVIQQLDDVWGKEKPFSADENDPSVISASGSANSQVAKRYPYACKAPWEAKLSFVPLKEQSIGVFIEFEDVFKLLLGNGDRQTWIIEKNDLGRKNSWTELLKEKLVNGKISLNKEVTVIILSTQKDNSLELDIKFRYVPEGIDDYIWEERTVKVEAKATDLVGVPARPFRIGLNDSRYKGTGSEIQFGIFSIKELR